MGLTLFIIAGSLLALTWAVGKKAMAEFLVPIFLFIALLVFLFLYQS